MRVVHINRLPGRLLVILVILESFVLALVLVHLAEVVPQVRTLLEVPGHRLVRLVLLEHFVQALVLHLQVGVAQVVNFLSEVLPLANCVIRVHTRMLQANRLVNNVMLENIVLDMD